MNNIKLFGIIVKSTFIFIFYQIVFFLEINIYAID